MREQFEKLPEIKEHLEYCRYSESKNKYISNWYNTMFINGAWYAYQEQQKKIDASRKEINDFFDNQTMTPSPREYANKLADILELLK